MFGVIVSSLDTDLEFPLFPDNFLCLFHIDTGHFHTDIARDIVETGERVDFCILGAEGIDLVFKDGFYNVCRCL